MWKKFVDLAIFVAVLGTMSKYAAKIEKEINNNQIEDNPNSIEYMLNETSVVIDENASIEEKLYAYLYNDKIDYRNVIQNYLDGKKVRQIDYLQATYMELYNSGERMDNILKELNDMIIMAQEATCVGEEMWNESFDKLIKISTSKGNELFTEYLPLAVYIHDIDCPIDHTTFNIDEDQFTCPNLSTR